MLYCHTGDDIMAKAEYVTDFTHGRVAVPLLKFALPLFIASTLQVLYNMVDMIVVGQVLGKTGLAAVSVGGDVAHFLMFLAMGFSNAGQVIISQYIGAKEEHRIGRFIGTLFFTLVVLGGVLTVGCLVWREPILRWMNTPAEAWQDALDYATVSIAGTVFIYGYNAASAVLRGMGDSKHPLVFIAIASILNVVLDVWFILGLGLRAKGAALATVISQAVSFLWSAWFIYRKREKFGLVFRAEEFVKIQKDEFFRLIKLGIPMAIKGAAIQFSKLFVNAYINSYGVAVSGFYGIANKIGGISNLVSNSLNAAGSSMVGQNIGAGEYHRVPRIMGVITVLTTGIAVFFSAIFLLFPQQVYSIFTAEAEVVAIGVEYLPIAVLIFFGSAARAPMNALMNGSGNTAVNFATAIFDGIVMRIGLALLFGVVLRMGYFGFWLGDALAGFTPLVIGIVFYFLGSWRKQLTLVSE